MRFSPAHLLSLSLWTVLGLACSGSVPRPATQAQLRQALERAPRFELQLAASAVSSEQAQELLAGLRIGASVLEQRLGVDVVLTQEVSWASMGGPRVVFGTMQDAGMARLVELMGTDVDVVKPLPGQVWTMRGADPGRPGFPITVHVAADRRDLLGGLENPMPTVGRGVRVRTSRERALGPKWEGSFGLPEVSLLYTADIDDERATNYLGRAHLAVKQVEDWSGEVLNGRLQLLAVGSSDVLREVTSQTDLSVNEGLSRRRLVLLGDGLPDDDGACAARWAAGRLLGPTVSNWALDGVAIDAAGSWWGRDLVAWGQHLTAAGLFPRVEQIVSARSVDLLSQHQLAPARGLLLRYLRERDGPKGLRALWAGEDSVLAAVTLDESFLAWLGNAEAERPLPQRPATLAGAFQVGVALASNGDAGGGYDIESLFDSLREARASGADSISITSFMGEKADWDGARVARGRQSLEGDVAIAQAVATARRAGMRAVTLQPHLLITRSAGYSAWQRRTNRAHWEDFFEHFDAHIVHHALLAELCGADILSLGTALSSHNANAGLDVATKAYHDERWAQTIGLARAAFGGSLTYAARFNGEAQHFANWDKLDFVGVSLFPRLTRFAEPPMGPGALRQHWGKLLGQLDELAGVNAKPVLVLESGTRSVTRGLSEVRVGAGPVDLAVQEMYWKTLVDALQTRRAADQSSLRELAGVYVWKWAAEPTSGGALDRSFSLNGKPAAGLLQGLSRGE